MGNATDNLYVGDSGKWFYASNKHSSSSLKNPLKLDSNPPDTSHQYMILDNQFEPIAENKSFAAQDLSCTRENDTVLPTQLYQAIAAGNSGNVPYWQPGTIPLMI